MMGPTPFEDDPAPNYEEDENWLDDNVVAAIENMVEILYDAGCTVNGTRIVVPAVPGKNHIISTDYGQVFIEASEIDL